MSGALETVKTFNSVARTVMFGVVLATAGYFGWSTYEARQANVRALEESERALKEKQQTIESFKSELETAQKRNAGLTSELDLKIKDLRQKSMVVNTLKEDLLARDQEIDRLDAALGLLMVDQRVARVSVLKQLRDESTGRLRTKFEFVELDPAGAPLVESRQFEIEGDILFVDAWVVKFADDYIRKADLHRASLVLFRRLFGEYQTPDDGYVVDTVGKRPEAYGAGEMSSFEELIWSEFWTIANNPERAAELGIRAAHGEAPSIRLEPDQSYLLQLRASDGLSIIVENGASLSAPSDL